MYSQGGEPESLGASRTRRSQAEGSGARSLHGQHRVVTARTRQPTSYPSRPPSKIRVCKRCSGPALGPVPLLLERGSARHRREVPPPRHLEIRDRVHEGEDGTPHLHSCSFSTLAPAAGPPWAPSEGSCESSGVTKGIPKAGQACARFYLTGAPE